VRDALLKCSRVYMIRTGKKNITGEILASIEKLDKTLGTNIFLKRLGCYGLEISDRDL
jgi:hypothetical protein